jgi:hypothetical protein
MAPYRKLKLWGAGMVAVAMALVGIFGGIGFTIAGMVRAEREVTRPWAGLQQRARTRRDGSVYIQTYYSKGPAAQKARIPRWAEIAIGICTLLLIGSFFVPF